MVALSEAAKEATYLRRFIEDLGFPAGAPTSVATDNTGAKASSYNPEHHAKMKHVERRHFYVRELVEDGVLTVPYVYTPRRTWQISLLNRCALAAAQFFALRSRVMNFERPVPDESARGQARMTRRDSWHQRAGGCCSADIWAHVQDLLDPAGLLS